MKMTIPGLDALRRDIAALKPGERLFVIGGLALFATFTVGNVIFSPGVGGLMQRVTGGEAFKRETCAKLFAELIPQQEAIARLGLPAIDLEGQQDFVFEYCLTYAEQTPY